MLSSLIRYEYAFYKIRKGVLLVLFEESDDKELLLVLLIAPTISSEVLAVSNFFR